MAWRQYGCILRLHPCHPNVSTRSVGKVAGRPAHVGPVRRHLVFACYFLVNTAVIACARGAMRILSTSRNSILFRTGSNMHATNSAGSRNKASVLVADATAMDCQLLSEAIQRDSRFRVIGRVVTSKEILAAVDKDEPDIAVISSRLCDGDFAGLLALRGLRALRSRSRVIMMLDNDQPDLVVDAFLNNARGVFCRIGSSGDLRKCLQSVHNGEIWINNAQMEYIVEALMQAPALAPANKTTTVLSKREEEITQLVATGISNRDVSEKLGLSPHTVKNCLSRIFEKLQISTRIELVLYVLSQPKPSEAGSDPGFNVPDQRPS